MAFVTWSDKLAVGVKSVDEQHMVLFEILNELHAAMMKGQARSVAGPLLHKLVDYTRDHFAAEEAAMASTKYPDFTEHQAKHRELTRKVEEYVGRFESGDITVGVHLLNFLSDWLTTHIQGEDKLFGPWMNDHGAR